MMTRLEEAANRLVEYELADAAEKHGARFHSVHEGYGVLMEEVMEAEAEAAGISQLTDKTLLRYTQAAADGYGGVLRARLRALSRVAIKAACEYIQVAAMAKKMMESGVENE